MGQSSPKQISKFVEHINAVINRFSFDRSTSVVGKADLEQGGSIDADIYNGTLISSQGFSRIALHKPSNTLCLIASKTPVNLRGVRNSGDEIGATDDGLQKSYIISAYRLKPDRSNFQSITRKLRADLRRYNESMHERSEAHFSLYGFHHSETNEETFTNGRITYKISKHKDAFKVGFCAPVMNEMDDPNAMPTDRVGIFGKYLSNVSKTISAGPNYDEQRINLARHWEKVSSKIWDNDNLYYGEGKMFLLKKFGAEIANFVSHHKASLLVTTAVGLVLALSNQALSLTKTISRHSDAALLLATGAAASAAFHRVIDIGVHSSFDFLRKFVRTKLNQPIEQYGYEEDASNYFKIKTKQNVVKLCPKMDMQTFSSSEFQWLDAEQSGMLVDHQDLTDGMRPESLRGFLLSAHQRGFSSTCTLPDRKTRVDLFQSGLVRFMHERPDGRVIIFAKHREELCLVPFKMLPDSFVEQMKGGIIRVEYDRTNWSFHNAFNVSASPVTSEKMMDEIVDDLLFAKQRGLPQDIKDRSYQSILQAFTTAHQGQEAANQNCKIWSAPILPDIRAIM